MRLSKWVILSAVLFPTFAFAAIPPDFGVTGIVTTQIGVDSLAEDVIQQPDGKLVVGGSSRSGTYSNFTVARYLPDGSLDPSFGSGGMVVTQVGTEHNGIGSLVLQPDGKIVAAGGTNGIYYCQWALARYNSDGSLDTSFGTGGKVITAAGSGYATYAANDVILQPDGKLVVAGQANIGGLYHFCLIRYNSDGSLDPSFGSGGKVTTYGNGTYSQAMSVALQPDGKLVAAGNNYNGSTSSMVLVRYHSDGSLDPSFGSGGMIWTTIGGHDFASDVVLLSSGKLVAGGIGFTAGRLNFGLVQYNGDGSLDVGFGGGDGIVTIPVGSSSTYGNCMIKQMDDKLTIAGFSYSGSRQVFALARCNSDGSLDAAFNGSGVVTTTIGDGDAYAGGLAQQADGKLVAVGYSYIGGQRVMTVARYNSDGSLDIEAPTITPTLTVTSTLTISATPTLSPTITKTPSITPTITPTPYVPVAGDVAWEDHFEGTAGAQPSRWIDETNDSGLDVQIEYTTTFSYAKIVRTPENTWGKTVSEVITCDVANYNIIEIAIAEIKPPAAWKLVIMENGTWLEYPLNVSCTSPGIFAFDYRTIIGWNGMRSFSAMIVVEGASGDYAVVDFVKVRKPYPGYIPEPTPIHSSLMDLATPVVLGHFMMSFGNPNEYTAEDDNLWHGWNENGHNPNNQVAPNKRDIASIYYPYFPNPDPDVTPDYTLEGPWDTTDPALVDAHINELVYADMDGGSFDLQSYYQIDGSKHLVPGVESWHVGAMRGYLQKFKAYSYRHMNAILVYEDKTQWKWVDHGGNSAATVGAAKADLHNWLNLFNDPAYDGVQYKIDNRPVVYIFSYENETLPRGRLAAAYVQEFKNEWANAHGGIKPILLTNIRQTAYPADLEWGGVKYSDAFDGFFDWPVIKGPANGPYDFYNDFALEKSIWAGQDINARYKILSGEYTVVGSGAWPGFDDWGVMGWNPLDPKRRGIPRKEGSEYLYPYHLNRVRANGYPVIQIASWNDWFEGTNIEPSVEFSFDYLGMTGSAVRGMKASNIASAVIKGAGRFSPLANVIMAASMSFDTPRDALFRYLDMTRDGVAAIKNKTPNNGNWWVPYWIYLIRHDLASNPEAQAAADAANAAIGAGNFAQAETVLQPWVVVLNYTPTPTPTFTVTPTATITVTLTETPTITETSTITSTPTITPTPRSPQQIKVWPEKGYIMYPSQSQGILTISKYQQEPQSNIRIHYRVLYGNGTFEGSRETYAFTGANAESANAGFTSSDKRLDLNIIQVDNLGLGDRKYLVIIVIPRMIGGASVGETGTLEGQEMVYDTEEEALSSGQTIMAAMVEMIPTNTPTITITPTCTLSPTLTPTLTPTATPTQSPWLDGGKVMAYPNPARGKVNFAYTISGAATVKIDIYRLTGERVASISEQVNGGAGQTLTTTWQAAGVAPGIYLCRIVITDSESKVMLEQKKKVALIR